MREDKNRCHSAHAPTKCWRVPHACMHRIQTVRTSTLSHFKGHNVFSSLAHQRHLSLRSGPICYVDENLYLRSSPTSTQPQLCWPRLFSYFHSSLLIMATPYPTPALPPPPGETSNFADPITLLKGYILCISICLSVTTIVFSLRVWVRIFVLKQWVLEDCMFLSLQSSLSTF